MSRAATTQEIEKARRVGLAVEAWGPSAVRSFPWRGLHDPYAAIVVEVLLQQTPAPRVAALYGAFFATYPDWSSLAAAPTPDLERFLRPLGLHRRRALALGNLARSVLEDPDRPLRERPGIGQYVDRAVAVMLEGARLAMIDTNFVRVAKRLFDGPWMSDYRYDRRLQQLGLEMILAVSDPRTANWAILDLAATICHPANPACGACPLSRDCAFANGEA